MKNFKILILSLSLIVLGCGDKKDKKEVESTKVTLEELHLEQEIKVLEAVTEEIKNAEESIETSIKKIDDMLNEIENQYL